MVIFLVCSSIALDKFKRWLSNWKEICALKWNHTNLQNGTLRKWKEFSYDMSCGSQVLYCRSSQNLNPKWHTKKYWKLSWRMDKKFKKSWGMSCRGVLYSGSCPNPSFSFSPRSLDTGHNALHLTTARNLQNEHHHLDHDQNEDQIIKTVQSLIRCIEVFLLLNLLTYAT